MEDIAKQIERAEALLARAEFAIESSEADPTPEEVIKLAKAQNFINGLHAAERMRELTAPDYAARKKTKTRRSKNARRQPRSSSAS